MIAADDGDRYLTLREAAEFLDVARSTLYERIRKRKLRKFKDGFGRTLVLLSEIEQLLQITEAPPPPELEAP